MEGTPNILAVPTRIAKSKIRVQVVLTGDPLSKQRPRMAINRGGAVYTPKQTKEAEGWIKMQIRAAAGQLFPDDRSAFGVRVFFFTKNRQRRDLDNMSKLVFDACNGLVWKDDAQVEELIARVTRADENPRTELVIYTLTSTTPYITCVLCGQSKRIYPSWTLRKFCSKTCANKALREGVEVPCTHCSTLIHRATHRLKTSKGEFFCTSECRTLHTTVELACTHCATLFRKARSLADNGRPFCSHDCRTAFWRNQRAKSAAGTCGDCGGPTTKRTYIRCHACSVAARRQ